MAGEDIAQSQSGQRPFAAQLAQIIVAVKRDLVRAEVAPGAAQAGEFGGAQIAGAAAQGMRFMLEGGLIAVGDGDDHALDDLAALVDEFKDQIAQETFAAQRGQEF